MTAISMAGKPSKSAPVRFRAVAQPIGLALMLSPIGVVVGWACGWDGVLFYSVWVLIFASLFAAIYSVIDAVTMRVEQAENNELARD